MRPRAGRPPGSRAGDVRNVMRQVLVGDDCWEWQGSLGRGYGEVSFNARRVGAHRWFYEWLVGPVPAGLDLDHLCRNRACVRPDHLEPVTRRENLMRGDTIVAAHAAKTTCPQGHPYDEVNTYVDRKGFRHCRICRRAQCVAWKERHGHGNNG